MRANSVRELCVPALPPNSVPELCARTLRANSRAGASCGYKNSMKRYRCTDWAAVRNATPAVKTTANDGKLKAPKQMRLSSKQKASNERIDLETKRKEAAAFKAAVHAYHAGWKLRQAGVHGEGPQGKHLSAQDYCWLQMGPRAGGGQDGTQEPPG